MEIQTFFFFTRASSSSSRRRRRRRRLYTRLSTRLCLSLSLSFSLSFSLFLSLSLSLSLSFSLFLSLFLSLCVRIERCACTTYNLSLLAKRSIFMERIFFLSEEQTTPSTLIFSRSSHRSFFGEWRGLEGIFLFRTKAKSGDDFSLFYLLEASVYLYETNERTHEFSRPKICSPISLERFQSILIRRFCELRVHLEHWLKDAFFQSPIEWYCLSASAKSSGVCFRALVSNHRYVCDV